MASTPRQFVATAGPAQENRELVADEFAAAVGENRRTTGETCTLLLTAFGGGTSEPPAVRDHAGLYCPVASAAGINKTVETQSLAVKSVSAAISAAWNAAKRRVRERQHPECCPFAELRERQR